MVTSPESTHRGGGSTGSYEGLNGRYIDLKLMVATMADGSRGDYGPGCGNQGGG